MIVRGQSAVGAPTEASWRLARSDSPGPEDRLAQAAAAITDATDDEHIGQVIVSQVAAALDAADVWLVLYDDVHEWLDVRAAVGPLPLTTRRWLPTGDMVLQVLLERAAPLVLRAPVDPPAAAAVEAAHGASAAALLRLRGTVLGYLYVRRALAPFAPGDLTVLQTLANLAALRLGYSQLATRPRERARELAELAPAWRPPLDGAGDYVLVTDGQGRVVDADGAACRLLGYSRGELLRLAIPDLVPVLPGTDASGTWAALLARVRAEGTVVLESSLRRRDSTLVPVRVQLELLADGGREVVRGIGWDLTERQAAQVRFLQTERLRVLGQLASGVAHDLNNTLAHVLGNLQLLLDRVSDPTLRAELERIQRDALDGAQTVRRLHSFARARDDRTDPIDLAAVVREVVEMTRPRWEALAQEQGVHVQVLADLAPVPPVLGNAAELREVFVNLVYNALDAMPQGGTLRLTTAARDDAVVVTVADTGVGIPARVRSRIFDPFFTTKGPRGSGLGLAVAYTIVSRHRGQIGVQSEEGQGTVFTVRLPQAAPAPAAAPREGAGAAKVLAPAQPPQARRGGRILAVDDEPDLAAMLARMLKVDGHEVQVCSRGAEALALLAREPFDLLLTDVSMPDMDGWEVARRAAALRPGLPIGLVTGWGTQYEHLDLAALGIAFVLSKPFSLAEARRQVARALASPAAP
ncbi:MAG: response regulator [Chloroflexi bacterium]|nr:response regulator [Chloroflexota bacterium]